MANFMIVSPHTSQECLRALDETLAQGSDILAKYHFGCKNGDHTAYAMVEATSEREARRYVPDFLRSKTRIIQVAQFSPEEIRAAHAQK